MLNNVLDARLVLASTRFWLIVLILFRVIVQWLFKVEIGVMIWIIPIEHLIN